MKVLYPILIFTILLSACDEFQEDMNIIQEEIIWATVRSYNDYTGEWEPELDQDGDTIKYIREIRRYDLGVSGKNRELKEILYYNRKNDWEYIRGIDNKDSKSTRNPLNWIDRSARFEKGKFMGYSFYTSQNEIDNERRRVNWDDSDNQDSLNDVNFKCPCKEFDSIPSIDEFSSKSGIYLKYHFESNYRDRDRSSQLANDRTDKGYFILPQGWGEISLDKLFQIKLYLNGKLYTGSMKFCGPYENYITICEINKGEIFRTTQYVIESMTKSEVINYLAGEPHGEYLNHFNNGQIYVRGNYKAGKEIGAWRYFETNGDLRSIKNYGNGKLVDCEGMCN